MNLTELLSAIATSIRNKKGTSDTINAQDFPTEIENISTSPTFTILSNMGEYTNVDTTQSYTCPSGYNTILIITSVMGLEENYARISKSSGNGTLTNLINTSATTFVGYSVSTVTGDIANTVLSLSLSRWSRICVIGIK